MLKKLLPALLLLLSSCTTTSVAGDVSHPEVEVTVTPAEEGSLTAVVNDEWEAVAMELLQGAKETIHVVHFECNKDQTISNIVQELALAVKRGVKVQVLLEGDVDDNHYRVDELMEKGVSAKLDSTKRYTHAKLIIVDSAKVLLGSTNLSYKSILYNNETNLLLESPSVGKFYVAYAQSLWDDPETTPSLASVSEPEIGLKQTLRGDDYFPAAQALIENAKERVYLVVYGFNLNPKYPDSDVHKLAQALGEAWKRGLDVKVIVELSDYNDTLNEVNATAVSYLGGECVPVRFDPLDEITHAKLLVADDAVIVGTNNWGHGGFHLYQEVGAVTDNAGAVTKLADYFLTLWEKSAPATEPCLP